MMEGPRHQHLHQEWQEPLEEPDGDGQDKHLHDEHLRAPVLRGAKNVLRHVLRQVLYVRPSRAT